ncbi:Uncharacterised protein [Klebsiella pneumoniae]|jgi:hypothetical protein|nr:Uncharacterised protein [Klebsiella pneumoniae]
MIERKGFCHFAANRQRPGISAQASGIGRRIGFIQAELIKVVVA